MCSSILISSIYHESHTPTPVTNPARGESGFGEPGRTHLPLSQFIQLLHWVWNLGVALPTAMATATACSVAISASGPAISSCTARNHCAGRCASSASFVNSDLFARTAALKLHGAVASRPVESRRTSVLTVCKISVGDVVPPIGLKDQDGKLVNLDKFRGKNLVLYFYPADFTPTCTKQACAFRDSYEKFKKAGAEVVGVSADSPELHKQFKARYKLPFTLLSDEGNKLRKDWAVPGDVFGTVPGRITYVIDKDGKVVLIYNNAFDAQKHIDETLKILQS